MADRDFDDFYTSQYGRLVVQLYAVTGSLPDAEDAVQEAFARASVHWGRVRAYELPEAWVRRVALNVAFTGLRRARRVVEVLARAAPPPAPPLPGASVELVEALGRLPLHFHQVLVLYYLTGLAHHRDVRPDRLQGSSGLGDAQAPLADLPVERVAGELGIAVGTAKSRLARARDALARQLVDGGEEVGSAQR
jgi:RNA polymerase sigma-70 factor, ECF subfamily